MDESFKSWRDSPSFDGGKSFLISDSDEDAENDAGEGPVLVIDSSDSSADVSIDITPKKSSLSKKSAISERAIKRRIKKCISKYSDNANNSYDNEVEFVSLNSSKRDSTSDSASNGETEEDLAETGGKAEETNESWRLSQANINRLEDQACSSTSDNESDDDRNIQDRIDDGSTGMYASTERAEDEQHTFPLDFNVDGRSSSESEMAISIAKQEIGVGNINPIIAQKRALLVCKMEQLQNELDKTKLLLTAGNIDLLPDKGDKLHKSIALQEKELKDIMAELERTPLTEPVKTEFNTGNFDPYSNIDNDASMKSHTSPNVKALGKKAQTKLEKEQALTVDRLQDLHGSLVGRPSEEEKAEDPQGLKVKLMPHQQHALAWLMWREEQKPAGGVLADDMGLGKTLTMISLIIATIAKKKSKGMMDDESDEEWADYKTPLRHKGGTLVVCPASLLSQWESEINNRCKRGMLSVLVYHGTNRENVPKRLAKYDVVITTYNILTREFKARSMVYMIHWDRVTLDEAHVVRNHKSQASESVCGLVASKRWALTGTPIQNKEMDLYSILKFLKCSPFDDLRVWKRWVDNRNAAGRQRLATVMKTLMLRRTKQELQTKGELESLPEKFIEEVVVKLDSQEQLVYEKVLIYSRTLFAQFLAQRAEKDHMAELGAGKYDKPTSLLQPNKNTQFTKAQNRLLSLHADVKAHEILVLLLRLRQICVHPSLIHSMLDQEDMKQSGLMESENLDPNLLSQINSITLQDAASNEEDANEQEIGVDRRVTTNILTSNNPVFRPERISSKVKMVLDTVDEILRKNDKLIIVSQWTSMLEIIASYLPSIKGATFSMFTGKVPIKERQGVMDSFNAADRNPKILLLSLTAGGVGLNLVGGNHLLLIDIHWNPQLEIQAQDRIYRYGQEKNVFIYKFICKDTIEERIQNLQEKKLGIAQNVLSGEKSFAAAKLTLNDLKSLFAL
ncbi:transcription termination factor lodestar [Andrena cerasifolii]|uniref:transcription termination factor lodestar n=1 Tax=Andrena cerasifolii TaxID=2819439 RepID=UPI004037BA82